MAAFFINSMIIVNPDGMAEYWRRLRPLLANRDLRLVAADDAFEVIEGGWRADEVVVIAAPDTGAIRALLASDDYAPLREIRQASSRSRAIIVGGR